MNLKLFLSGEIKNTLDHRVLRRAAVVDLARYHSFVNTQPLHADNLNVHVYNTAKLTINISSTIVKKDKERRKRKRKNVVGCYQQGVISTLIDLNYNVVVV